MSTYNVYFLEENDNVRVLFDRLDLVNELVKLYNDIGVNVNVIITTDRVSNSEKDMINTILGTSTFKNSLNVRSCLLDVISYIRKIFAAKQSIDNSEKQSDIKEPAIMNFINETKSNDTNHDIEAYNSEKMSFITREPIPPSPIPEHMSSYTFIMDTWWKENKEQPSNRSSICVLYNPVYECSLVRAYTKTVKDICFEFGDFEIVREYQDIIEKNENVLRELISNNMYCNRETLEKKLEAFESLYDTKCINQYEDEKSLILFYIKQNYIISDDVTKRIKVTTLIDEVQKELNLTNPNLKYNFANHLAVLGLRKKRFADGMYLYGIESKASAKVQETKQVKSVSNKDYEAFIKSRDKEIRELYKI